MHCGDSPKVEHCGDIQRWMHCGDSPKVEQGSQWPSTICNIACRPTATSWHQESGFAAWRCWGPAQLTCAVQHGLAGGRRLLGGQACQCLQGAVPPRPVCLVSQRNHQCSGTCTRTPCNFKSARCLSPACSNLVQVYRIRLGDPLRLQESECVHPMAWTKCWRTPSCACPFS